MNRKAYIKIVDCDSNVIGNYGDIQDSITQAKNMPSHLIWAIVDVEDKDFFAHKGVSFKGIFRSFFKNLWAKKIVSGGSSITQQLAKNILQNEDCFGVYDKSIKRKVKEALMAWQLEEKYSKWEILTFYLNRVYFGAGTFGVQAASKAYFDKPVSELNLYESAALVGILQAPSRYAGNNDKWKVRTWKVLQSMLNNKHISQSEYDDFKLSDIKPIRLSLIGGYFTDWVIKNIPSNIPNIDLVIKTTLSSEIQESAHNSVNKAFEAGGKEWNADQGSMLVCDKNGAIKAMVGGLSYHASKFNRAVQAKRSVGSFFKYYVFLEAVRRGVNPDSQISDARLNYGSWNPSNYFHRSKGSVPLKIAFAQSVNSSSVMLLLSCGIKNVIELAKALGITSKIKNNPTIALGGFDASLIELNKGFLPILNKGNLTSVHGITEIRNAKTNELLYKYKPEFKKVLDERTVWYMWQLLKFTVSPFGSGRRLVMPGKIIGGKSGTSNNYKDVLFVGATSEYIFSVWFGRDDFAPMNRYAPVNLPVYAAKELISSLPGSHQDIDISIPLEENLNTVEDLLIQD